MSSNNSVTDREGLDMSGNERRAPPPRPSHLPPKDPTKIPTNLPPIKKPKGPAPPPPDRKSLVPPIETSIAPKPSSPATRPVAPSQLANSLISPRQFSTQAKPNALKSPDQTRTVLEEPIMGKYFPPPPVTHAPPPPGRRPPASPNLNETIAKKPSPTPMPTPAPTQAPRPQVPQRKTQFQLTPEQQDKTNAPRAPVSRPPVPTRVALQPTPASQAIKEARQQAAIEAAKKNVQIYQSIAEEDELDYGRLQVLIPDRSATLTLGLDSSMTVDDLMDDVIRETKRIRVELQGSKENLEKTLYGIFIPHQNIWCVSYKNVAEYYLVGKNENLLVTQVELRLRSKEEELHLPTSPRKVKKSLAISTVPSHMNNRKNILINLLEFSMMFSVECDPGTSFAQILEFIVEQKPTLQQDIQDFEVTVHLKPNAPGAVSEIILLQNTATLSAVPFHKIDQVQVKRAAQNVILLLENGTEKPMTFHPDRTMQEILTKILIQEKIPGDTSKALFLAQNKGAELLMELSRTLRSYRFAQQDKLLLASKNRLETKNPVKLDQCILIKIYCSEFNCDRTLKSKATASVAEVIYRFCSKVNGITDIGLYGLYIPTNPDRQLEHSKSLSFYHISNLADLVIKRHGQQSNPVFKEKVIFGIDLAKCNLVQADSEQDLKVPAILEELKKALFALHGLDVEKIFLKKGNPLKEKMIIEELQADVFPEADNYNSYDPHDIASVIKEWFAKLPVPIFKTIDEEDLSMCAIDEEECHVLPDKCREPYRSLFLWLLELMFEIAKNSNVNSVEIGDIAGAFAPHMQLKPVDFLSKALVEQKSKGILVTILEGMLSDWGSGVHGGAMKNGMRGLNNFGTLRQNKFLGNNFF